MTPKTKTNAPPYAFCESVTASSISPWCIREVTPDVGLKLGGGVDTASFCGRVKVGLGWDLSVPLTDRSLQTRPEGRACNKCLPIYRFNLWKNEVAEHATIELHLSDVLDGDDPYDLRESMKCSFEMGQSPKDFVQETFAEDFARQAHDREQAAEALTYEDE